VLILTRGGGSLEDLWPFNEEAVARAVAAVSLPIIVGVGHETDFTIAEFAADLRAPTPSQAAELAVPEQRELLRRLSALADVLGRSVLRRLHDQQRRIDVLEHRLGRTHPGVSLKAKSERLSALTHRLQRAHPGLTLQARRLELESRRDRLVRALRQQVVQTTSRAQLIERSLLALSPKATLERGYAIVTRTDSGELVTRSAAVDPGTRIDIRLAEGEIGATVEKNSKQQSS
jgi:exodeoxyribonuclease VII large subunit